MSKKRRSKLSKLHIAAGSGSKGASYWLQKELEKVEWRQEREAEFADAVDRPSMYELRNMAHGVAIPLGDTRYGVFWSKGFRGCEFNCGHKLDDWSTPMYDSVQRKDGVVVWRRSCRKTFNKGE